MARVKRELVLGWDLYLACQHTFGKCAARIILQFLGDTSEFIYKTSHSSVRGANHGAACFHAAKNGVRQVLMRTGGVQKPSVVCYVHQ
jgi:hypothetical protein